MEKCKNISDTKYIAKTSLIYIYSKTFQSSYYPGYPNIRALSVNNPFSDKTEMAPPRNMFWGLVVKPNKRYETEVQEPFRITKVTTIKGNFLETPPPAKSAR